MISSVVQGISRNFLKRKTSGLHHQRGISTGT